MIILPINAILQGQSYTRPQVDAALAQKQDTLSWDSVPTENSNNPVRSSGIKTALDGKQPIAENEEQAPVGYVLTKTSTGSQWQRASSEGGTIAAAANSYPVTLTVANWSNNQYVIPTPVGATLTTDSDGILGLASNASKAQVEAFQLAKIVVSSQDANGITIIARGQVPTIALNLELTVFMKTDYYTTTQTDALLATKAPLASPAFTGTPTAPTAASGTNTTQVATTAFVKTANDNLKATTVNPNLLRNWYFVGGGTGRGVFPVNSKGLPSYDTNGYTIDGWSFSASGYVQTLLSSGLQLTGNRSQYYLFSQRISDAIAGKTVTIAIWSSYGLDKKTLVVADGSGYSIGDYFSVDISINTTSHYIYVGFKSTESTGTSLNIVFYAVKLELGTEQTLAHQENGVWVLNEIPDYEYELYRCMTSTADPSDNYANKTLATGQELAYVENGDNASQNIIAGQYVIWKGSLYKANQAISSGAALSGKLTAVSGGGLNDFKKVETIEVTYSSKVNWNINTCKIIKQGNIVNIYIQCGFANGPIAANTALVSGLPNAYGVQLADLIGTITDTPNPRFSVFYLYNGSIYNREEITTGSNAYWYMSFCYICEE